MSESLLFICASCGWCIKNAPATCGNCRNDVFKVAQSGGLSYRTTPKNPYKRDPEEDGYQFNTPFDEGDASNAALGNGANSGSIGLFHEPGDSFDRNMEGGDSENFMPEDSPLRSVNKKEPRHLGPHNMPQFNSLRDLDDLYERVRKRRQL
jgi:hypothetical protein